MDRCGSSGSGSFDSRDSVLDWSVFAGLANLRVASCLYLLCSVLTSVLWKVKLHLLNNIGLNLCENECLCGLHVPSSPLVSSFRSCVDAEHALVSVFLILSSPSAKVLMLTRLFVHCMRQSMNDALSTKVKVKTTFKVHFFGSCAEFSENDHYRCFSAVLLNDFLGVISYLMMLYYVIDGHYSKDSVSCKTGSSPYVQIL